MHVVVHWLPLTMKIIAVSVGIALLLIWVLAAAVHADRNVDDPPW